MARSDSATIVEEFFGESISHQMCETVRTMPASQLRVLMERLHSIRAKWLIEELTRIDRGTPDSRGLRPFQPVFSGDDYSRMANTVERWLKCSLMYYPGTIVTPDPILGHLDFSLYGQESEPDDLMDALRFGLYRGLRAFLPIGPLVAAGTVVLFPTSSVQAVFEVAEERLELIEELAQYEIRAQNDLMYRSHRRDPEMVLDRLQYESWPGVRDEIDIESEWIPSRDRSDSGWEDSIDDIEERLRRFPLCLNRRIRSMESVGLEDPACTWAWAGSELNFSPVFTTRELALETERIIRASQAPDADRRVSRLFTQFVVPGADSASLSDVVRLRQNEEVFSEFRTSLERALLDVERTTPVTQGDFEIEFARSIRSYITPVQERIVSKVRRTERLDAVLTGTLLVGAAGVENLITGQPPVGSAAAAVATVVGQVVTGSMRRRSKTRNEVLHREFLLHLMPQ